MRAVGFLVEQRQQGAERRLDVSYDAEIDRGAPSDVLRPDVDLRDADARSVRIELPIRKVRPEHQQDIAIEHGVVAGRVPDQPGHADVVGVLPLDVLLAAHGVHHRRLESLAQRQQLRMSALAARTAQDGDTAVAVEYRREPIEIRARGHDDGRRRQQSRDLCRGGVGCGPQRHVAGNDDHGYAALADRLADRDLEDARHLIGAGDEFAIVAALPEQRLWMRLLKVAGTDLRRRDLRRDSENGHARTVAVEEAIDEVQVPRTATAGAHGEIPRQMRLRACREGGDLLVPDMDPLDLPLPADRVGQAIEAIADDSIDSLDARGGQRLRELVGYRLCHESTPGPATCRAPQARAA